MLKIALNGSTSNLLNKRSLKRIRMIALRNGHWFRALLRIDRTLVDLALKVTENIRSVTLAKGISTIINKLEENFGGLSKPSKDLGLYFARKLSLIARRWGNNSANTWAHDLSSFRFLAFIYVNDPRYKKNK